MNENTQSTEVSDATDATATEITTTSEADTDASSSTIEDVGVARKKVSITVPETQIANAFREAYKTLKRESAIPGFRRGRAPGRLLEKRFGPAVKEQVTQEIAKDTISRAITRHDLRVVGEPQLTPEKIELPESGPLQFYITIEVEPEFPLPDLTAIEIKKPKFAPSDERLALAMSHLQRSIGEWVESTEPVGPEDMLTTNIKIFAEDGELLETQEKQVVLVAAGVVAGLRLPDVKERLTGSTIGQTVNLTGAVPQDHANEKFRGKSLKLEIEVLDAKRFKAPELDETFAVNSGFENLEDMRNSMRQALGQQLENETQRAMRNQVSTYLLDHCEMALPENVSARQQEMVMRRRFSQLFSQGVQPDEMTRRMEEIRAGSAREAQNELKLYFILKKLGEQFNIKVSSDDIFAAASEVAFRNGTRPEKVVQDLQKSKRFDEFVVNVFESKVIDHIISTAKVVETDEATWRSELAAGGQDATAATPAAAAKSEPAST